MIPDSGLKRLVEMIKTKQMNHFYILLSIFFQRRALKIGDKLMKIEN